MQCKPPITVAKLRAQRACTHYTARQSPRKQSKSQEQHEAGLPRHAATTIAEAIGVQSGLFNRVDDQHSQRGTNARNPVDKFHMHLGAVARAVRECGGIDQEEEPNGELFV